MSYLIIGSSSGLGRELAYTFAEKKEDLILVARDIRDLKPIKSDLEYKFDIEVEIIELDFVLTNEIEKKLFSHQKLFYNLKGVLFPIGLMHENDDLNLSIADALKILNANYLSIGYTVNKLKEIYFKKEFLIVGFGSVSGFLGRNLNNFYAAAKRSLESHFESLVFDNNDNRLKIHFYILGYLDTNLAFGKKLLLPKGKIRKLARIVYKNKEKKIVKRYFPFFWGIISIIFKLLPILIIVKFKKFFKN